MSPWMKGVLVLAGLAIVIVIVVGFRDAAEEEAWAQLAAARELGTVEALERAREAADGTSAEPWSNFHLSMLLYQEGTGDDLERARQVASASIEEYPEHATTSMLRDFLATLSSYDQLRSDS